MSERCLSFDLEWSTRDYPNGVRDGDLACFQHCELFADGTATAGEVLAAWPGADARAREVFADALMSPSWVLLGQNVAQDVLKPALQWGLLAEADRAYREGRVRCTFLAQRFIDVGWPGRHVWISRDARQRKGEEVDLDLVDESQEDDAQRGFWKIKKFRPDLLSSREVMFSTDDDEGGRGDRARAGLAALVARYLGKDISKDKQADSWRMRYGELIGTPVADWPAEAVRYAADDPVLTALVRVQQVKRPPSRHAGEWCDVAYPPVGCVPWAPFRCERFEAYAHFALVDMERLGLARDQPRVERMRETLRRAALAAEGAAIRAGVVRLDVGRDMSLIAQMKAAHAADPAAPPPPDKSGLDDLRTARDFADRRDAVGLAEFVADRPWIGVERVKDSKEVLARAEALYRAAGMRELPRTKSFGISAGAEHLQQVVRPAPGADDAAATDLRELVGTDLLAHLQAWTDAGETDRITRALDAANDPGLASHMARQKCNTFDSSFLAALDSAHRVTRPDKWRDPYGPARFGFSPFKSTARTGVRGDVRQNMPQRGGVRECFTPRPGRVFVTVDYSACEIATFADVLDDLVCAQHYGQPERISTLGQAVRAGMDCHLNVAASVRGEPYAQLAPFYKRIRVAVDEGAVVAKGELKDWKALHSDRDDGKRAGLGFMGGMGPKKFARLQRKAGKDMTEDRARVLRVGWLDAWDPEVRAYLEVLATQATGSRRERRSATVIHMRGGHVRGGLDYCQWANTHFQQLAAAGAKRAAIMLFRACRIDQASPLYHVADPALFVHDEFILEVDQAHAETALTEVRRLMEAGMAAVCRTPVRTEGKILRERWSK
jgi:hypothetical protein